jgi:hypothetical protein
MSDSGSDRFVRVSVVDPASRAIDRTRQILFEPFDFGKWLTLGFCAFLAHLGEGGGGSVNFPGGGGGPGGGPGGGGAEVQEFIDWLKDNLEVVIAVVTSVFLVGCLLSLLILWLNSRGKFMLIDGIVHNRGAVKAPWREYRREGNSLFAFQFCYGLICFLLFLLIAALSILIALPSIRAEEFGTSAVAAIVVGGTLMVVFVLASAFISMCLVHFVVPIMYRKRIGVMDAWGLFRREFFAGRVGTFLLYVLFQIVIGLAVGVLAMFATCATCCIAALPYVGSVILLPLFVFMRSYQLCFLEQFGPEWIFFADHRSGEPAKSPPPEPGMLDGDWRGEPS